MSKKRIVIQILEILAGVVLLGLGVAGKVEEFWSGMGGALMGIGSLYMIQNIRYQKNAEYREAMNAERNDERNQFLSMKAWQWAGGWFVSIAAIGIFIFKFAGKGDLMMLCSGSICLLVTLYWVCYLYLRKKY